MSGGTFIHFLAKIYWRKVKALIRQGRCADRSGPSVFARRGPVIILQQQF